MTTNPRFSAVRAFITGYQGHNVIAQSGNGDTLYYNELLYVFTNMEQELHSLRLRDAQVCAAEAVGIDNWDGWGEVEHVDEETFDYDEPSITWEEVA